MKRANILIILLKFSLEPCVTCVWRTLYKMALWCSVQHTVEQLCLL